MLERNELFELFARHRADPAYWTAERLAELYGSRSEWVGVLLEHVAPPIYARVDGDVYGVFAVRPEEEFSEADAAAKARRRAAAAAKGGKGSGSSGLR